MTKYHRNYQEKDSLVKLGRDVYNFYRKYAIAFVGMIVMSFVIAIISGQLGKVRKEKIAAENYQIRLKEVLGFRDHEKFYPKELAASHLYSSSISVNWDEFINNDLINDADWHRAYSRIFYGSIINTALHVLQLIDEYQQEVYSNRALRVKLEKELSSNSLAPAERKAKEQYLSKLIEEKVSTGSGDLTEEERRIVLSKAYNKASYFIERARKHILIIAKYSPFVKYKGNPIALTDSETKVPRNSKLGVTHGEMFESAKRILNVNTDHIENINSEMFMIELSKGMSGKMRRIVRSEARAKDLILDCATSRGCEGRNEWGLLK